jgi:SAM-dependent methyltransferase
MLIPSRRNGRLLLYTLPVSSPEKSPILMDPRQEGTAPPLAAAFTHPGVAMAYRHRPPYPGEVFDVLDRLITDRPQTVLDLGAGEGALARPLARRVDHVDAVDISAAMVAAGRQRPGGQAPNLRWIVGAAETAKLDGPVPTHW